MPDNNDNINPKRICSESRHLFFKSGVEILKNIGTENGMTSVASFTIIFLTYLTCTIFSLFCLLQPCCWLVEVTVKALNVYKKYIFPHSRTCRHEFCYEKNGFLLNVENCIELTYWHVKSIQNLSCSDKRMTPLSISLSKICFFLP